MEWSRDRRPYGRFEMDTAGERRYINRSSHRASNDRWQFHGIGHHRNGTPGFYPAHPGPSFEGSFGELSTDPDGRPTSYRDVFPGDATADPEHHHRAGPRGWEGFGHLVLGIDGGDGYSYWEAPSEHALADWVDDGSPYRPGYGAERVESYSRWDDQAEDRGYLPPVEHFGHRGDGHLGHRQTEMVEMYDQMAENNGGGRLMEFGSSGRGDEDEFMTMQDMRSALGTQGMDDDFDTRYGGYDPFGYGEPVGLEETHYMRFGRY